MRKHDHLRLGGNVALHFGAYLGGYYAMLDREPLMWKGSPVFRADSLVLDRVFWLAHKTDQMLRPNYWPERPDDDIDDLFELPELPELEASDDERPPPFHIETVILK